MFFSRKSKAELIDSINLIPKNVEIKLLVGHTKVSNIFFSTTLIIERNTLIKIIIFK